MRAIFVLFDALVRGALEGCDLQRDDKPGRPGPRVTPREL